MKKIVLVLIPLIFLAAWCEDDNPVEPANNANTLTISHSGVDWSAGKVGSQEGGNLDYAVVDGETIAWCPNGDGGGWETGVWYRTNGGGLYKMGTGNIGDYNAIDTTKYDSDICDNSLNNGEVWAAKCLDGYVIFKVKEQPVVSNQDWAVKVEYKFSVTTNF